MPVNGTMTAPRGAHAPRGPITFATATSRLTGSQHRHPASRILPPAFCRAGVPGFLAPLITREIVYRLLLGAQGGRLGQVTALGGATHRIAGAVERLRRDFARPLSTDDLARDLGMSVSGFHHHFKTLTTMSPLQFQRQLRLQEARRLLLGEGVDVASAGRRVGDDDPSYFSREYKHLFGAPPLRHVAAQRAEPLEVVSA